jgi:hypothetical protein
VSNNIIQEVGVGFKGTKIRRIKAETGFGGKSSWLNPVFGNRLINLCQKKG